MEEKTSLDILTQDSVSVKKQKYTTINGVEYLIGDIWRKAYMNSTNGRIEIKVEIEEPYRSAIFAMWGDSPTVEGTVSKQ